MDVVTYRDPDASTERRSSDRAGIQVITIHTHAKRHAAPILHVHANRNTDVIHMGRNRDIRHVHVTVRIESVRCPQYNRDMNYTEQP